MTVELESNLQPIARPAKARPKGMPDTVKILLEENDNIPPTGLFIGVNGRGYLIRPGEEVQVPKSVVEVLDHAVMSTPVTSNDRIVGHRDRMRYPYRRLG